MVMKRKRRRREEKGGGDMVCFAQVARLNIFCLWRHSLSWLSKDVCILNECGGCGFRRMGKYDRVQEWIVGNVCESKTDFLPTRPFIRLELHVSSISTRVFGS